MKKCPICLVIVKDRRSIFCGPICYNKSLLPLKQKQIDDYSLNPKICPTCSRPLPFNKRKGYKYCSIVCSYKMRNIGRIQTEQTKEKIKQACTGKTMSESAKLKMKAALSREDVKIKKSKSLRAYYASDKYKGNSRKGKPGKSPSVETRMKIGKANSLKGGARGRTKWYEVGGQKVQGTWERNIAQKFEELGVKWHKPKTSVHTFSYVMNGKTRFYTPDFLLLDLNIYLEVKGYWWGSDKEKMRLVFEQHPQAKIFIIEKLEYENFLKTNQFSFIRGLSLED